GSPVEHRGVDASRAPLRRERVAGSGRLVPAAGQEEGQPLLRRPIPDEQYLDGTDALLQAHWLVDDRQRRAVREWLAKLPRPRDDFVAVPRPLLAALNPSGALLAELERRYRQGAAG